MRLFATAALLASLAGPAAAQIGNPATGTPGTPPTGPGAAEQVNAADRQVVQLVAGGSMAEVQFGRLASQKSENDSVREFARWMVDDHTRLNTQLAERAQQAGIPVPNQLDNDHMAVFDQLQKLSGIAFDLAYAQSQVIDHQAAIIMLQYEVGSGQNDGLKQFAIQALPTIFNHLEHARNLQNEVEGRATVARGVAAGPPAGGGPEPKGR